MQDIFLSTSASSAGQTNVAPGGVGTGGSAAAVRAVSLGGGDPASQVSEGEATFGATLSAVFDTSIGAERLDEIASQLESLGLDTSFLDDLGALVNGKFLSLEAEPQGTSLPQLSTFLSSSLTELAQSLGLSTDALSKLTEREGLSTAEIPEDVLSSLLGIVNSIQKAIETLKSQTVGGGMLEGSEASMLALTPNLSEQSSGWRKPLQMSVMAQSVQVTQVVEGETRLAFQAPLVGLPAAVNADNSASILDDKLFNSMTGESLVKTSLANEGGLEAILEKTIGSGVDRNQASGLKTSFADAQLKLESAPYSTTVMNSLDDLEWGQEVGQKIVWLTGKAIQSAEIHLNPAELGPIDVKISVQNDAAVVSFNAHNASVREMLEANVTRLREMMEANGVELQDVNVDARQGDERYASGDQQQGSEDEGAHDDTSDSEELPSSDVLMQSSSNIVDYFA